MNVMGASVVLPVSILLLACGPSSRTEKPAEVPITLAQDEKSLPPDLATTLFEEVMKKGITSAEAVEALRKERGFNPRRFFVGERADLDGDGKPELLVRSSRNEVLCTTANCPVWVYRVDGPGYDRLLEDVAGTIDGLTVFGSSTQGMKDIRVQRHVSASEREVVIYRYDGETYRPAECATDSYGVTAQGLEKVGTVKKPCSSDLSPQPRKPPRAPR